MLSKTGREHIRLQSPVLRNFMPFANTSVKTEQVSPLNTGKSYDVIEGGSCVRFNVTPVPRIEWNSNEYTVISKDE